jgi:hypothetical protein
VSASLAGREARPRVVAGGDGPLGRGARGPLPLRLEYQWTDVEVTPTAPLRLRLVLGTAPPSATP